MVFVFLSLLFSFSSNIHAEVRLKDIRYHSYPDKTRIVVEISGADAVSRYKAIQTTSETISLSISGLNSILKENYWDVNDGLIKNVSLNYSTGTQILINLENGSWNYNVFSLRNPPRVIIDVLKSASERGAEQPASVFLKTIVIDAGHGGRDVGAVGPTGLKEKDITLALAQEMEKILQERGIQVILTRDHDEFVSLQKRVSIANSSGADLFLSIHCNASISSRARGFESYFLSPASDDLARAVETVENSVIMLEGNSSNKTKETILADLKYTEYRTESKMLARIIQTNLDKALSSPSRGIKSALFYVLKGVEAPAVLVEVSFISNPTEEKFLRSSQYKQLLAEHITESILQFKKDFDMSAGFTK